MRRSMIAVSALALITTLGACASQPESTSDGEPAASENDAPAQEAAPAAIEDFATLVKTVDGATKKQKTVSVRFKYEGDPENSFLNSVTCQANLADAKYSCTGPVEAVGSLDNTVFFKHPAQADPAKPWSDALQAAPDEYRTQAVGGVYAAQTNTEFDKAFTSGTDITDSAPDEIDGEQTIRYELVTDIKAALDDPATSDGDKNSFKKLLAAGITETHATLWLGANNLPVQMTLASEAMTLDGKPTPPRKQDTRYSDWGKPVDIKVPSPDQVSTPGQ